MTLRILPAALAALALALPAAARAQGCVGAPLAERTRAVQLQAAASSYDQGTSDEGGAAFGASFRHNPGGPFAYAAEYQRGSVGDGGADVQGAGVTLAARAPLPLRGLALCARVGAHASRLEQGGGATRLENLTVPLGVVLEVPLAGGALVPYVAPQYLISGTRGTVVGLDYDASASGFGAEAGAGIRAGRAAITVGGTYSGLSEDLVVPAMASRSFFVRVGVLF